MDTTAPTIGQQVTETSEANQHSSERAYWEACKKLATDPDALGLDEFATLAKAAEADESQIDRDISICKRRIMVKNQLADAANKLKRRPNVESQLYEKCEAFKKIEAEHEDDIAPLEFELHQIRKAVAESSGADMTLLHELAPGHLRKQLAALCKQREDLDYQNPEHPHKVVSRCESQLANAERDLLRLGNAAGFSRGDMGDYVSRDSLERSRDNLRAQLEQAKVEKRAFDDRATELNSAIDRLQQEMIDW